MLWDIITKFKLEYNSDFVKLYLVWLIDISTTSLRFESSDNKTNFLYELKRNPASGRPINLSRCVDNSINSKKTQKKRNYLKQCSHHLHGHILAHKKTYKMFTHNLHKFLDTQELRNQHKKGTLDKTEWN